VSTKRTRDAHAAAIVAAEAPSFFASDVLLRKLARATINPVEPSPY
jgi:hypothetical protein